MTKILYQSGFTLNVLDDGVNFCARKLWKKLSSLSTDLYHLFLFDNGDVYLATESKRNRRCVEAGDSIRVGAYTKKSDVKIIEGDIRQHMRDIGMAEFGSARAD